MVSEFVESRFIGFFRLFLTDFDEFHRIRQALCFLLRPAEFSHLLLNVEVKALVEDAYDRPPLGESQRERHRQSDERVGYGTCDTSLHKSFDGYQYHEYSEYGGYEITVIEHDGLSLGFELQCDLAELRKSRFVECDDYSEYKTDERHSGQTEDGLG